jgi:nitroreductase
MLIDLIKSNRSYRGYDHSRQISREELLSMVEAARLCPSSVNIQPLRYFLACDPATVATIQSHTRWAKGLPDIHLPHPGKEPTAFIVICQDTSIDANLSRFQRDVGIVAQTMLLTAVEMGLGGCMIGNFSPDKVRETLELEERFRPVLVIALGKPDETVVLTELKPGESFNYYRDENDVHYVPKRPLEEIIIK